MEACNREQSAAVAASFSLRHWWQALRPRHWSKNLLVLVAPLLGGSLFDPAVAMDCVILFAALAMLASSAYLLNDLIDRAEDRLHPEKCRRPLAAGLMTPAVASTTAVVLVAVGLELGLWLPPATMRALVSYLVLTLAYSLVLKRLPVLDVAALALLFTLRVDAGSTLVPVSLSPWLLAFSMLFFTGLALLKRHTALRGIIGRQGEGASLRGYGARHLLLIRMAGLGAALCAMAVMAFYLAAGHYPAGIYARPVLLWGPFLVILAWLLRIWHLSVAGRMADDPVIFALGDRYSLGSAMVCLLFLAAAWAP